MSFFEDLATKTVLITGAASGIGQAQLHAFLTTGAEVLALDQQVIESPPNSRCTTVQVDICDEQQLTATLTLWLAQHGPIDVVCNTAGILDGYTPSLETSSADWDRVMTTNLKSQYLVTNAVLPAMVAQKHGTFVNMASIAGLVAGGGGAAYTASKHAIIGYTKQLDYDYASQGIRANCIAPGAIATPMNAADFAGAGIMAQEVAKQTPAGRWAEPAEVANLSVYLASDVADYIHGTVVPIDGGWIEK
ncbi:3-oxoacyl-ACP reductase [Latilactobacillus graminis]|uniref:Short chain dehydrogenase family protein n=2 Tax=Latilactobacillus graminis TaxID=60519 RepID=A0AA89KWS6_9LACO|nr:3-oxoacyl-ACP reductase [Latilactobacillus graminis]KRM21378.1 short chain dehydrogenase family protein [Latilactobacillus graminis DSM 20719]QFP79996.1 3-oxoacyl-ACP reductase [Latilactobacillus graminis]